MIARALIAGRLAIMLLFCASGCLTTPRPSSDGEKPPDWSVSGIRVDTGVIKKAHFFEDERLGDIVGIQVNDWYPSNPGQEVAFVSTKGVAITTLDGQVLEYADFRKAPWAGRIFRNTRILRLGGEDHWGYFYPGDGEVPAFFADRQGRYIWNASSFVREYYCTAVPTNMNDDGNEEFLLCGRKKMAMLDPSGKLLWERRVPKELNELTGLFRCLYVADVAGDGHKYIVENLHNRLLYFSEGGEFVRSVPVDGAVSIDGTVLHYPTSKGPLYFLGRTRSDPRSWALVSLDGKELIKPVFEPSQSTVGFLLPIQLEAEKPAYWVTHTVSATQGRAVAGMEFSVHVLAVCEPTGRKIYEETLSLRDSTVMAALPATPNGEESILVAGVGRVVRYRLKK